METRRLLKRVLIVEDEADLADIHRRALVHLKLEPVWSNTGTKAVEMVHNELFALVIMDLKLPDGHGGDFCEAIWLNRPDQPIMIVSGSAYDTDPRLLRASAILLKPFPIRILMDAITKLVDSPLNQVPSLTLGFINPPLQ